MELLAPIFKELDVLDQVSLAMACKTTLQAAARVPMKISALVDHRVYGNELIASEGKGCKVISEQLLDRVWPLTRDGQRDHEKWAKCLLCYRFRPTAQKYWKEKAEQVGGIIALDNENEDYCDFDGTNRWNSFFMGRVRRPCCPMCYHERAHDLHPASRYVVCGGEVMYARPDPLPYLSRKDQEMM